MSPLPVLNQDNVIKGMLAAIGAFFMLTVMNMFAKMLSDSYHVAEIAFYRNLISTIPFLIMIFAFNKKEIMVINKNKIGVVARAVLGTISLIITFAAFAAMPMADTTSFLFTASLIIPILGYFFLGERVGIFRIMAIIIGFAGVMIMINPSGQTNLIGVGLALTAAMFHASLQTVLRFLGRTESPVTITFYFVAIGTIVAAIPLPWVGQGPAMADIPIFIAVGLSGALAQYLLSMAFGNAPAAVVTVFSYSGIIWATFLGWLIWSDWPTLNIWIGGSIVIICNIFMIWREARLGKVKGDRVRAKL